MSSEQLLNVKFVKAVEARPCLWDNKSKKNRNKEFVTNAWCMISAQFLEPVDSCRERWRNIRNAFLRSMKRPPDNLSKRKEYYLTDHLQFLLPFVQNRQIISHESDNENVTISEFEEDIKPGSFLDEISVTDYFYIGEELKPSQHSSRQRRFIAESTTVSRYKKVIKELPSFDERLAKKRKKDDYLEDDDRDMAFFKSLLRDVRQMNDRQNRKFRVIVMQIVNEFLDVEYEKTRR